MSSEAGELNNKSPLSQTDVSRALQGLSGQTCWYVSCGQNTGSSFGLALGKKIKRGTPLDNKSHPASFQKYQPEHSLMVWCAWRLSKDGRAIAASSDSVRAEILHSHLRRLSGQKIASIESSGPIYDLRILFSTGWRLDVFRDCEEIKPSANTRADEASNWEIFAKGDFVLGV